MNALSLFAESVNSAVDMIEQTGQWELAAVYVWIVARVNQGERVTKTTLVEQMHIGRSRLWQLVDTLIDLGLIANTPRLGITLADENVVVTETIVSEQDAPETNVPNQYVAETNAPGQYGANVPGQYVQGSPSGTHAEMSLSLSAFNSGEEEKDNQEVITAHMRENETSKPVDNFDCELHKAAHEYDLSKAPVSIALDLRLYVNRRGWALVHYALESLERPSWRGVMTMLKRWEGNNIVTVEQAVDDYENRKKALKDPQGRVMSEREWLRECAGYIIDLQQKGYTLYEAWVCMCGADNTSWFTPEFTIQRRSVLFEKIWYEGLDLAKLIA